MSLRRWRKSSSAVRKGSVRREGTAGDAGCDEHLRATLVGDGWCHRLRFGDPIGNVGGRRGRRTSFFAVFASSIFAWRLSGRRVASSFTVSTPAVSRRSEYS